MFIFIFVVFVCVIVCLDLKQPFGLLLIFGAEGFGVQGAEAPRVCEDRGYSDAGVRFESVRICQAELWAVEIDGWDCGGCCHHRRWSSL